MAPVGKIGHFFHHLVTLHLQCTFFLTEVDTNPQLEGSGGAVQSHYDHSTRTVQNLCVTRKTLFKCPLQMEIGH